MKRKIALIMALLMLACSSAVVSAAEVDTDGGNSSTSFTDETVIKTTGGKDQVNVVELASFTEDGSVNLKVLPVVLPSSSKGVTYTGSMTYLIELVDAE